MLYKIRQLFRLSIGQSEGANSEPSHQRWSLKYCSALSKKLTLRRTFSPRPTATQHAPQTRALPTIQASCAPLRVAPERRESPVFDDVFSSLELADTPTTPFGIKAFNTAPQTRPLVEHVRESAGDEYHMAALASVEDPAVLDLITHANAGLSHESPQLCSLGTGGVYFLTSASGDTVAVLKPTDEEPRGINNPKGYQQNGEGGSLREGIRSGEGAMREHAAYLLDHGSTSGVPATTMVSLTSKRDTDLDKVGSLQRYVPFDYDAEECGTGLFTVEEVHKICLADLRYINADRNGQNILVTKRPNGQTKLTPIDHGYCFPDAFRDLYFEWMYWPQAKQPFSPAHLKFIEEVDPEADLEKLRRHDIVFRPECNQVFLFANYLLKWAAHRSCTPCDIASILSSRRSDALEKSFQLAIALSDGVLSASQVYRALNRYADALMSLTKCT